MVFLISHFFLFTYIFSFLRAHILLLKSYKMLMKYSNKIPFIPRNSINLFYFAKVGPTQKYVIAKQHVTERTQWADVRSPGF